MAHAAAKGVKSAKGTIRSISSFSAGSSVDTGERPIAVQNDSASLDADLMDTQSDRLVCVSACLRVC
eukprot:COSAG03_NODE_13449_length_502_cov_186.138958_1_plen_66_part_10